MPKNATATPDWDADLQVYEPHKAGLPKLRPYFRDLFGRLQFAAEFSKSGIKAAHSQTVFGQLWLVLNPLLLAVVYYILVAIIQQKAGGIGFLAHIVAGLFVFTFISASLSTGAGSVTGGGRLILNMSFPRLLMPMAAVRTAFFRFLPTLPVYLVIKAVAMWATPANPPEGTLPLAWAPANLLGIYFLGLMVLFSIGLAAIMATLQVYFRDTSSFLPFFLRIWLYLSPVLWLAAEVSTGRLARFETLMLFGNPLFSLIGGWTDLTLLAVIPPPSVWIMATVWAVVSVLVGSLFFISRERDFAVRI
jgi:teichoic acid transport system permease protein